MMLTTQQTAEKLSVSKGTIHKLVRNGALKDYSPRVGSSGRHHYVFDSREVSEFSKTFLVTPRRQRARIEPAPTNGHHAPVVLHAPVVQPPLPIGEAPVPSGLATRLARIETKLDHLDAALQHFLAAWT